MAPRNISTPKTQNAKPELSPNSTKRKIVMKKSKNKTPSKLNNNSNQQRQRSATVPNVAATPKPKGNKTAPQPSGSVVKSVKKSAWKRKPKPAHSGVPVPEKMKRLGDALFNDLDCSL